MPTTTMAAEALGLPTFQTIAAPGVDPTLPAASLPAPGLEQDHTLPTVQAGALVDPSMPEPVLGETETPGAIHAIDDVDSVDPVFSELGGGVAHDANSEPVAFAAAPVPAPAAVDAFHHEGVDRLPLTPEHVFTFEQTTQDGPAFIPMDGPAEQMITAPQPLESAEAVPGHDLSGTVPPLLDFLAPQAAVGSLGTVLPIQAIQPPAAAEGGHIFDAHGLDTAPAPGDPDLLAPSAQLEQLVAEHTFDQIATAGSASTTMPASAGVGELLSNEPARPVDSVKPTAEALAPRVAEVRESEDPRRYHELLAEAGLAWQPAPMDEPPADQDVPVDQGRGVEHRLDRLEAMLQRVLDRLDETTAPSPLLRLR